MSTQPLVELNHLHFRWQKPSSFELNIPHLKIDPGEKLFVLGESGSGKSSLLYLLAGLLRPQQGKVNFLGNDLSKLSESQRDQVRAGYMGFVFQMFNLLPYLSPLENIVLSTTASPRRKRRAEEDAGSVESAAIRLMEALQLNPDVLRRRATQSLSVGEQQRIACARALLGKPELIIADEPTSALDTSNRDTFLNLLLKELDRTKAGLVFVSHDKSFISYFDRCVDLSEIKGGL